LLITYADQLREPGVAPAATLAEFAKARLTDVISGVHLLPFFPWSSDDGFSVKDFFGVDPIFGAWSDIEQFRPEFDLMFDAVFNHMSAEGEWFQKFCADEPAFRDFFVTVLGNPDLSLVVRPRALPLLTEFQTTRGPEKVWTTFSADQVDLNFKNPQVLLASLRALLFYVARGARFIRLDAIAYLWKEIGTTCIHLEQTHQIIQLMRAVLDEVAPGVRLITETNVPHRDNISYFGDGTNEAQLVYNFALPPLVLHSIATGNAEKLTRWAATLETPSPQTTFFNFLASHDGIGLNPARGILSQAEIDALVARALAHGGYVSYKHNSDGSKSPYEMNVTYFDALSSPERNEPVELQVKRFLVAHAIMFSLAGVPGIYFHSLFGSRNDRAGAESSGIPRRINRQKLAREKLESELADPASLRAQVFTGMRHWLGQRHASRAFAPGAAQRVLALDPRVFAILREPRGGHERKLCLHNVSNETVALPAGAELATPLTLAPYEVRWETLPALG
jgi:glycosidase